MTMLSEDFFINVAGLTRSGRPIISLLTLAGLATVSEVFFSNVAGLTRCSWPVISLLALAGLAAWPRFPRLFYPLASPAKARLVAGLTPAFRPGFDPGFPGSGQAPDTRACCRTLAFVFEA